ncbi:MAG: hypothetical protein DRP45_10645 [Candidatus Zixiibacteriota bacterium]|nr:MAG: hypothetical protein DRP45_10645 [candidate division Zixibacteria bacterium]
MKKFLNKKTIGLAGLVTLLCLAIPLKAEVYTVTIFDIQDTSGLTYAGDTSEYLNDTVKTYGIVTGVFGTAFFIEENPGGAWHGVYVYRYYSDSVPQVTVGDSVEVIGQVQEYRGLTEIKTSVTGGSVTVLASGVALPGTTQVTVADINNEEMYEGVLVRVDTVHFEEYGSFSGNHAYHIITSDGVDTAVCFVRSTADGLPGWPIPSGNCIVVGNMSQYYGLELLPRDTNDIVPLGNQAPVISDHMRIPYTPLTGTSPLVYFKVIDPDGRGIAVDWLYYTFDEWATYDSVSHDSVVGDYYYYTVPIPAYPAKIDYYLYAEDDFTRGSRGASTVSDTFFFFLVDYLADIKINEVLYDAANNGSQGPDSLGEWIELYNAGTETIDLSGWKIADDPNDTMPSGSGDGVFTIPAGVSLAPGEFLILTRNADTFNYYWPDHGTAQVISYGSASIYLGNSGDDIHLFDVLGHEVDVMWYGSGGDMYNWGGSAVDVDDGNSLERPTDGADTDVPSDDFAETENPTPGLSNTTDFPPHVIWIYREPYVPLAGEAVTVRSLITDDYGVDSAKIYYRVNGGSFNAVTMTSIPPDTFEGVIPAQSEGDLVEFYVKGWDTSGQADSSYYRGYFVGTMSIADIKVNDANGDNIYRGYGVRITGVATVPTGVFRAPGNGVDIYIQDNSGKGINVYDSNDTTTVDLGDSLVVVGAIWQYYGKTEIEGVSGVQFIEKVGTGTVPDPVVVTPSTIGEDYEGLLIKMLSVHNTGTGDPWPDSGQNANIAITDDAGTDTVIMRIDKDTDIDGSPEPTGNFDVTGVCTQYDPTSPYDSGYQIMPRWRTDIVETGPSGPLYVRGDANADGAVNVTDAVFSLGHLFSPQFACQRSADANADDALNVSDVLFLLGNLFPLNIPAPTYCGDVDTFNTSLPCDSFPPCGWPLRVKTVPAGTDNSGEKALLRFGSPEFHDGYIGVPIYVESDEDFAGIQVEIRYSGNYDVRVSTDGCVSEDFDYFNVHTGNGEVDFVGVVSLTPAEAGEGVRGLEAGVHRIAEIIISGSELPDLKAENVVIASVFGYSIEPVKILGIEEGLRLPTNYALFQNIPNPFSGNTVIKYALPKDADVELTIYNIAGQKVRTLVNGRQAAAYKAIEWDGRDDAGRRVSPGVYFGKMTADKFQATRKLTVLR